MIDIFGNNVVFLKLPVDAATTHNEDGSYTIFLSDQLSDERRMECYVHELKHIHGDDFYKSDVQEIEALAHAHD